MGNELNHTVTHAEAIMTAGKYNIASCSKHALGRSITDLDKYACIDLILGLEKDDGRSLKHYKTFTPEMQGMLEEYADRGGNLIVSGAYVGSDMTDGNGKSFLDDVLHVRYNSSEKLGFKSTIKGMGTQFDIYTRPNEEHYAATSVDLISPTGKAFCALTDYEGKSVCVAYDGRDRRSFTMGFPFECITSAKTRATIMRGILNFIFK